MRNKKESRGRFIFSRKKIRVVFSLEETKTKKQWKWQFDQELKTIKVTSSVERQYIATMFQGRTDDLLCVIEEVDSDGKQIALVGTVVVDRPTAIIDQMVRKEEVRQNIKAKILEYEA